MSILSHLTRIVAVLAVCRASLAAQMPTNTVTSSGFAVEEQSAERWMHARQLPRFTRFAHPQSFLFIDSIQNGAARRIFITLGRTFNGRDSASVVADSLGRVTQMQLGLHGPRYSVIDDDLKMSEPRLWDIVPSTPRGTPHVGLAWTDTVAHEAIDGPYALMLHGTRVSRIVGDTTVDARHLWRVRDSALVTFTQRFRQGDTSSDPAAQLSRDVRGVIRGMHLYDPARRLDLWRVDTTRLAGEAVLRYPDGRVFRTPARYERTGRLDLLDSARYAQRIAALRRGRDRAGDGMVNLPTADWQKRLGKGDPRLVDSLINVWRRTTNPDAAFDLFMTVHLWGGGNPRTLKLFDSVRVAAGDTAYLYETLMSKAYGRGNVVDAADARAMIAFMDPAMVWSIGSSHSWLAANLVQGLTTWPRAAALTTPACTPEGCAVLGTQWPSGREPVARDVGLVALFSVGPRRWADTVLALNGPAHPLLDRAALLARGVGATWPAASKAPLPSADAGWHDWLEWMNGVDPRFVPADPNLREPTDIVSRVRFEESHEVAIRIAGIVTGRDIVADLKRDYERETTDSTRFVFAVMLERLGALQLSEAEIADALTSRVPARVALGIEMLDAPFNAKSTTMSDSAAAPLVDRILAAIVGGTPLWRSLELLRQPTAAKLPDVHVAPHDRFVLSDSLPASVQRQWSGRANLISGSAWTSRDLKTAGVLYAVSSIRTWGRFARVSVDLSEHVGRRADEAPEAFAAGQTYYLMLVNGEWLLVTESGWIT